MNVKTIPALEARTHLGEIMNRSFKNGERFLVEKAGIPMIAIVNAGEYQEYARILQEREERFKIVETIRNKIQSVPSDEINQDVHEAVKAVRKQKRA